MYKNLNLNKHLLFWHELVKKHKNNSFNSVESCVSDTIDAR